MTATAYRHARSVHLASSALIALLAVTHSAMTWSLYAAWNPDAAWFLGTGLSLLLLSTLNLSHIGVEPCRMPTTKLIRIANWAFALFAVAVCFAVRQPHAYALTGFLVIQAAMSHRTLPGPASSSEDPEED